MPRMSISDQKQQLERMSQICASLNLQLTAMSNNYNEAIQRENVLKIQVEQLRQEVERLTAEASRAGKKEKKVYPDTYYGAWRKMLSQRNEMQLLLARLNEQV
jgi:regulator of replication initiation timing